MRVFITGGSGFVGSAVVQELINAGHQVLALARSEPTANALAEAGAEVHPGDLEDLDSLKSGVAVSDAVIHAGFVHDFSDFVRACETDRRAIETFGEVLTGSDRPLIVTSGLGLLAPGRIATEEDVAPPVSPSWPRASETTALSLISHRVNASVIRLSPSVHGEGDHGFVPMLIDLAREKGVSAYVGDGSNRWAGVHRLDAARLYRLALEQASAGAIYHGAADEGVAFRDLAEVIGKRLNVPVVSKSFEEAAEHFGWLGYFAGMDIAASSQMTQERLDWHPAQLGLLADIDHERYFRS